ncbi:hypothetical protein F4810DRAFT_710155 [Camillea tinctor]|nr:hypothetical protein F4810DRAFT_710155 [Camillea tinctor]
MQTSATVVGIFAALAAAQLPSGFPDCGVTCITNMLGQAGDLGCNGTDATCLCTNANFVYGIRDCANESCADHASEVIQYGVDYCAAQGIAIGGFPSASSGTVAPTTTVEATGSPTSGSQSGGESTEIVSTITNSDGSAISTTTIATTTDEASGTAVPIATTELVTTTTNSDGSVATSTFSTSTIFSSGAASSDSESGSATESASLTTITSASSFTSDGTTGVTSITTTGPASSATGGSEETTTGGEGASSTAEGFAAQQTAAPALVAAAGLVFLML